MASYEISFQRFSLNGLPYPTLRYQRMFKVLFTLQKGVMFFSMNFIIEILLIIQLGSFNPFYWEIYILISWQTLNDMFNYMIALTSCTWFIILSLLNDHRRSQNRNYARSIIWRTTSGRDPYNSRCCDNL